MIERHLAHVSDEELGGSYDRTTHFEQRRRMIQAWADVLDGLAGGKAVEVARNMYSSSHEYPQAAIGAGTDEGLRVAA